MRRSKAAIARDRMNARYRMRVIRHGKDWRGILCYYDFMCQNCGSLEEIEIHEPFGKIMGRVYVDTPQGVAVRTVLCRRCHSLDHNGRFDPKRGYPSLYLEDIQREIREEGGLKNWKRKYKVGESIKPIQEVNL